jgi:hypothetical protein
MSKSVLILILIIVRKSKEVLKSKAVIYIIELKRLVTARTREHNEGVVDCCIPKILN